MSETIKCQYSLFDEGRQFSGNHRKYLLDNAMEICYSPATRERIKLREAFGYYGHGRRIITKKMEVGEVELATMPDGTKAIVDNVPSNVTVAFEIDRDGTIRHVQEILDTEPGRIVSRLNASRVGGFSWACPGKDGGTRRATVMEGFSGFDYVLRPGFATNRGYVLEAADENKLLESVAAVVGDDKKAELIVENWRLSSESADDEAIFEAQARLGDMQARYDALEKKFQDASERLGKTESENIALKTAHAKQESNVRGILECLQEAAPFFIPDEVVHQMMEGDFARAKAIFEEARRTDLSQLPLFGNKKGKGEQEVVGLRERDQEDWGSAGYGFALDLG